ncbi:DUF6093 family protein [Arthrobacter sp. zg.Y20]|nr:DUF6093 family protein [Arthrobacter sp. zg.Y20]
MEELMLDTCIIDRPGKPVTDPQTGVVSPSYTAVYSGACKVQQTLAESVARTSAGAVFTIVDTRLDIPVNAGPVQTGDRARIVEARLNPALTNSVYRIVGPHKKSAQTAQRLRVEELG